MTTRQMRRGAAVLSVLLGLVGLTGCGKSGGGGDSAKPAPSLGAAPSGEPDATATPTSTPDAEIIGSTPVKSAQFTDTAGFVTFATPSKDVACTFIPSATGSTVTCQPATVGYTVQEPGSCPQGLPWGSTVQLTTAPVWVCDIAKINASKVLDYGGRLDIDEFNCVSRPDGVTCRNYHTDHGFRISPAYYTFF
jgi:hypothetical protein